MEIVLALDDLVLPTAGGDGDLVHSMLKPTLLPRIHPPMEQSTHDPARARTVIGFVLNFPP
jgi:hypothetical protein